MLVFFVHLKPIYVQSIKVQIFYYIIKPTHEIILSNEKTIGECIEETQSKNELNENTLRRKYTLDGIK